MKTPCPHCGTFNRLPERLDGVEINCGQCHRALLPSEPVELDSQRFERFVGGGDLPAVVDFWAPWCGPCRMMAPHYAQAARHMTGVRFAKLDTEAYPHTAAAHRIQSIPTIAIFHGGREVARRSGALPASELTAWIRQVLAGAGSTD